MSTLHVTTAEGASHEVDALVGEPLMHALRGHELVPAVCGGMRACGTCHIYVQGVWWTRLVAPGPDETGLLRELGHYDAQRSRLSCQIVNAPGLDGLVLTIAPQE